jgi:nitrate reductase gamma subunit
LRGETFRLKGERLIFSNRRYLWFFSLLFHLSMLVIILRHLRFFFEPVPDFVLFLQQLDGIFELSHPTVLLSTVLFTSALFYLLSRRIFDERARFVSLPSDYVILLLLLSVAITGILSRHFFRTDLVEIKRLILGLLSFTPYVPKDVSPFFYLHLLSVCLLFAIIPWTKVVHMAGILMSPTRNLPNTSRRERHINPWDYPVKVRTYEEYKKEFGEVMKAQGLDAEERGD